MAADKIEHHSIIQARTLFVSHIHEDSDFAQPLKMWLDEAFLGAISCFVSSSPASLPPGSDWPAQLKAALQESMVSLLLLSPVSVSRQWLLFEAGAGFARGIPVVPLCIAGLNISDLRPPLSLLQAIQLNSAADQVKLLALVADTVGLRVPRTIPTLDLPNRTSPVGRSHPAVSADAVEPARPGSTLSEARDFLRNLDPKIVKRMNELFLMIALPDFPGNNDHPSEVARLLKTTLSESVLVPAETAARIFETIDSRRQSFTPDGPKGEFGARYDEVQHILDGVFELIPTRGEAEELLLELPQEAIGAFLAIQYGNPQWPKWTQNHILDIVLTSGYGAYPLPIFKQFLASESDPTSAKFKQCVVAAQEILGPYFDSWYLKVRGVSRQEDLRRYREEQEHEREWREREAEKERGRQRRKRATAGEDDAA